MSVYIDGMLMEWKIENLRKHPVPLPICPLKILCGLTSKRTRSSTKHLSHDMEVDMKWKRVSKNTINLYELD
jgi:hypothetical protein